ncbi:oxidoreductase [Hyaloraphidium curvatum]|nr:oxidoreductase [Hyaloraphidium curvatum]
MVTEDLEPPTSPGSLLLENLYISLDPYLRGRMKQNVASYAAPFKLGEPFLSHQVSRVLASNAEGYKKGDLVYLRGRWETHSAYPDAAAVPELRVLEPAEGIPLSYYIGSLGMPGMTAWAGLNVLAHPEPKETLFVSAASGAVGQSVVQYGKKLGMRVVGSAGSDDKCEWVKEELGADEVFNYKKPPGGSIAAAVKAACPEGIDVNFENVGGETYQAVLENMNKGGRISVCGWISGYNSNAPLFPGPEKWQADKESRGLEYVKFFLVSDYYKDHREEMMRKTTEWIKDGSFKVREDVTDGLEKAPEAFIGMLAGKNFGKAVVRIKKE